MANLEGDLAHRNIPSSIDDSVVDQLETTSDGCSSKAIDPSGLPGRLPGGFPDWDHEEISSQSAVIDVSADYISPRTTGSADQIDDGLRHQPIHESRDKGKAPARIGEDPCTRFRPVDEETSDASLDPWTRAVANSLSTAENQEEIRPRTKERDGSLTENGIQHGARQGSPEPNSCALVIGAGGGNSSATSPKPSANSKQKQKIEPDRKSEPQPVDSTPTGTESNNSEASEAAVFRPLQYGDPGWEKSADRPPKKLPIRLKDAVGRRFVFPWEKAKTWAGMERLIRSCFAHVNVLGPYVNEGRYDLLTSLPFSTDIEVGVQHSSPTGPPEIETVEPQAGGTSGEPPMPHAPTPPPAPPSVPVQQSAVIILPELWEDLVEPGMYIQMHLWPIDTPPPPPPPPLPHPPGSVHPLYPHFGGRGRGRGRGMGRGQMGSMAPFRTPPGVTIVQVHRPKGKTRKRADGL